MKRSNAAWIFLPLSVFLTGFSGGGSGGSGGSGGTSSGSGGPSVSLTSPFDGEQRYENRVTVTGSVSDADGDLVRVDVVLVSATDASKTKTYSLLDNPSGQGSFTVDDRVDLILENGSNTYPTIADITVSVEAEDAAGNVSVASAGIINGCGGSKQETSTVDNTTAGASWPQGDYEACSTGSLTYLNNYLKEEKEDPSCWWFCDTVTVTTPLTYPYAGIDGSLITENIQFPAPDLTQLANVTRIDGDLVLRRQYSLQSLNGIAGLSVGGEVIIANNEPVYYHLDITELANIDVTATEPAAIRINNNGAITQCEAESVIQTLRNNGWGGESEVSGNAPCQ